MSWDEKTKCQILTYTDATKSLIFLIVICPETKRHKMPNSYTCIRPWRSVVRKLRLKRIRQIDPRCVSSLYWPLWSVLCRLFNEFRTYGCSASLLHMYVYVYICMCRYVTSVTEAMLLEIFLAKNGGIRQRFRLKLKPFLQKMAKTLFFPFLQKLDCFKPKKNCCQDTQLR
jgi:hypothetical protein